MCLAYGGHPKVWDEIIHQHVPFLQTTEWDTCLGYLGHAKVCDEIIYQHGHHSEKSFVAYYLQDRKLLAATAVNRDDDLLALEFALQQGKCPTAEQVMD